jgi:flagellar basal body-associated protein FliL
MRWLLLILLVSLAAMLIAAAGGALHIMIQRARSRSKPSAGTDATSGPAEESDTETEV